MFSYILYVLDGTGLVENFQAGLSMILDGYKLSRRHRRRRRVSGVTLCVREYFDFIVLRENDDKVECLTCVRIREKANILVGVCYRSHNHDEELDKIWYKQLPDVFMIFWVHGRLCFDGCLLET